MGGQGLGASGSQELSTRDDDPIAEANELVDEGRLNEAMRILEEAVREDPELIEASERVMKRIRAKREEYNDEFERLIENLTESPEEIERTLAIIDRMEELDEFPNQRVVEQVSEARVIAQLAYDRDVAANIMAEAAEFIEEDRYADAVERYLSGFDLQRERFEEREYGNVFRNRVDRAVTVVEEAGQAFIEEANGFREAVTGLQVAADTGTTIQLSSLLDDYTERFEQIDAQRGEITEAADDLGEQREEVRDLFPDDPVDWHIRLIHEFTAGRPEVDRPEGIAGALRTAQTRTRRDLVAAFGIKADESIAEGHEEAEARQWEEALSSFDIGESQAAAALRLSAVGTEVTADDGLAEAAELLSSPILGMYAAEYVRRETAAVRGEVVRLMAETDAARVSPRETDDLETLAGAKSALGEVVAGLTGESDAWAELSDSYNALEVGDDAAAGTEADTLLGETDEALETRLEEVTEYEIETLDRIAQLRDAEFGSRFATEQRAHGEAVRLIEGVEETVEQEVDEVEVPEDADDTEAAVEEVTVTYRYPDQGLEVLLEAQGNIDLLRADVAGALDRYRAEAEYVRSDQRIEAHIAETQRLLEEIDALAEDVASRITGARDQIARAQELREEGDELVAETRTAIANLEVEQARESWNEARDRFYESLELQQDDDFRAETDEIIAALGAEIQEARNTQVVEEVRGMIDEAESMYDREEYQQSRQLLIEARELWSETNVDPNPEVERLLNFVNAALNLEGTRSLAEGEPLYPALSSYLNLARQDFRRAENIASGDGLTGEAEQLLDRAERNVDNVTTVRPYNWEARVLKLRILQLRDAEDFDEVFERRFEDAVERKEEDPREALTALEALAEIDSDYPGLQDQIAEVEIELGIRPDPVTEAQIAESNRLQQRATELADEGGEAQREAAMSNLEEALELNPDNRDAQLLLDRLRIQSGGQATVTLSSAEEQQLRRAEDLFIEDNAAQAYAIVQRLMQDEQNRRYPPLIDLEQRIADRLGI
ncbi:MAG: hypothetical protein ACLFUM_05205 [Spirochaetaceae bacterium]